MKKNLILMLMVVMLFQVGCGENESVVPPEQIDTERIEENVDEVTAVNDSSETEEVDDIEDFYRPFFPDPLMFLMRPYEIKESNENVEKRVFYLEPEEYVVAEQFLELLLEGDYHLEPMEIIREETEEGHVCIAYLKYTGNKEVGEIQPSRHRCQVYVSINVKEDLTIFGVEYVKEFWVKTSEQAADYSVVAYTEDDTDSVIESVQEKEIVKSETNVDPASKELPDLRYYLNTDGSSPYSDNGGMQYGFKELPLEYKETLKSELLGLLQEDRYQLKMINSYRNDITEKTYNEIYEFTYTGTGSLTPLSGKSEGCHVLLMFGSYTKVQDLKILINYSKEFQLTDPGERTSLLVEAAGSSGGSSGIGNWNPQQAEFTKKDCFTCDGDGECTRCNGYSYIWRDDIKSDCTRCSGGRCPTCGGTGKRN